MARLKQPRRWQTSHRRLSRAWSRAAASPRLAKASVGTTGWAMVSHPPLGPAMERPAHSATKSVGSSWSVRSGSDRDEGSTAAACWRQLLSTTTLGRAAKCRPSAGPCKRQALSPFRRHRIFPPGIGHCGSIPPKLPWIARQSHSVRTIDRPHSIVQKLVRNFQIDRRWYEAVREARCDFLSPCRLHAERGWHCLLA